MRVTDSVVLMLLMCCYNEDQKSGPSHKPLKKQQKEAVLRAQYTTSYTVAFLSPDPVTMYLSSGETSQLSTDEDSLD